VNRSPRIIVALDFPDAPAALGFAGKLSPDACRVKVGKELFTSAGPVVIEKLVDRGFDVFLDLKFHDIPNTVAAAVSAAANMGVWMLNVHGLGGRQMLEAARNALAQFSNPPLLIAVTILTSMDQQSLSEVGLQGSPIENVLRLASLARAAGLDGVVCSPQEVSVLRQELGEDFLRVTPGIRLASDKADDQKRIMTPLDAIKAGSDYLVMGRSITRADAPDQLLLTLNSEIDMVTS
jgi:orotidine-5'-phosphate decarboxylase